MLPVIKQQLKQLIQNSQQECFSISQDIPPIDLEIPNDKNHGEFACNIAMRLAKVLKQNPLAIAEQLTETINKNLKGKALEKKVRKVEFLRPGFINFHLSWDALYEILYEVFQEKERYGKIKIEGAQKTQIEFVSANPTGPLSVAHARQAAVGDALANILNFLSYDVQKEYYVNDEGNQINILGKSIELRIREILGETIDFPEEGYQGEYIKEMAKQYMQERGISDVGFLSGHEEALRQYGVDYLLNVIRKDLDDFNVHFDVWAHQSKIATEKNIKSGLAELQKKGFLYEKDGAVWFRSTDFGDDKDRVVQKSDGSYTYLTPDIVYHKDKFKRGFKKIINIWGPDHHGYIPRIKASVQALGHQQEDIDVLIVQLATIYRDGTPLSMSTRRGQYISLREVIDEVGVDASRFFFLMRRINAHLDFDLELAKKESPENPVYYIQYAHARIYSIRDKAEAVRLKAKHKGFQALKEQEELDLIKKIGQFSDALFICTKQLDPFALVNYLQELASLFHKFYDLHRVVGEDADLSAERLALIDATRIVLANGLKLLGISVPKKM